LLVHVLLQAVVTEAERVKQRKADREAHNAAASSGRQQSTSSAAGAVGSSSSSSSTKAAGKPDVEKNPSARPDRVAESCILQSGRAVNRLGKQKEVKDTFGHLPGIPINHV
jgi:hypothetical protein